MALGFTCRTTIEVKMALGFTFRTTIGHIFKKCKHKVTKIEKKTSKQKCKLVNIAYFAIFQKKKKECHNSV